MGRDTSLYATCLHVSVIRRGNGERVSGDPSLSFSALHAADSKFMYPFSIKSISRQAQRDIGMRPDGSKGCGREMDFGAPLRDGFAVPRFLQAVCVKREPVYTALH